MTARSADSGRRPRSATPRHSPPIAARALSWLARRCRRYPGLFTLARRCARIYPGAAAATIPTGFARGLRWKRRPHHRIAWWMGSYEIAVQQAIVEELAEGDVFYDVGAGAGFHSLVAARRVGPTGRVVSFEPDPASRESLQDQVEVNAFDHWAVSPLALAGEPGRRNFRQMPPGANSGHLEPVAEPGGSADSRRLEVEAITLDQATERWPPPRLVKIDVEGAETEVLRGARRALAEHRPVLIVELHSEASRRASLEILARAGYRSRRLDGGNGAARHIVARPGATLG